MGPGIAPDGRKIGRNKDADAIVNSADLYFAQLKRDSTTRNYARYRGDDEKANEVFHDPSIAQIKMHVNPYLQEQKEKEKDLLETAPDEMLIFQDYSDEPRKPKSYAGVSYKEKLAQIKARKEGKPVPPSQRELEAQQAAEEERKRIQQEGEIPKAIPVIPEDYTQQYVAKEEPTTMEPPPHPDAPVVAQAPVMDVPPPPVAPEASVQPPPAPPQPESPPVVSLSSEDVLTGDTRADIRTLMGLILKHRGGPGFGAGRLQGEEAARLEALAQAIPQVLRQEPTTAAAAPPVAPAAPPAGGQVDSMIACIEGAVTMYRNSPAQIQSSVLVTLRAALLSALDTLAQVVENASPMGPLTSVEVPVSSAQLGPEQQAKITSMNACIEGAITMYRNSPAELKSSVLVTLNAALLSAVNTCNEVMAVGTVPTPSPTPVVETTSAPEPEAPPMPQYDGNDPNTQRLEEIYEKISNAGGDGPMGLRTDMTPEEAQSLQDSLSDMRTLLVDELHSGIPGRDFESSAPDAGASPETEATDASRAASTTTSKYKQMLQKAREEKETNDGFQ